MYNQFKTVILLGALTTILLLIGSFFGNGGLFIAFLFALIMNVGSYFFSHKIVLAMYRAKEASQKQYPRLYHMVEKLSKEAKIPEPKIYIIPTQTSNAFATGRNPEHAVVAVTEGIMHLLSEHELEGVLAHELAHIKNRDILITTIAATIASVISYIAFTARYAALFGGVGRDRDSSNIVELLFLALVAPIAALIIQLAISRSREYLADASGARFIKNGKPLASALKKLEDHARSHPLHFGSPSTASLFIVNPFSGRAFMSLFSTHPPMEMRIQKLEMMKF